MPKNYLKAVIKNILNRLDNILKIFLKSFHFQEISKNTSLSFQIDLFK